MTAARRQPRAARRDGWWIPWLFVAFFAVVVGANGILVVLAMDTWTGLETEDAYRKGLRYNEQIAAAERQRALGWQVDLDFAPAGGRAGRLTVTLRDRKGTPLRRAEVDAKLVRPTHVGYDFALPLDPEGGGRYAADIRFPLAGQWDVRVTARRGADRYRLTRRISVAP